VDWIDDPDSRVKVLSTALGDIRGIIRLGAGLARGTISVPELGSPSPPGLQERDQLGNGRRGEIARQLARFVVVGVASTLVFVVLYLLLRQVMSAEAANAVSLLVTAIGNTAVNRRFTFGIRGRAQAARHQLRGLIAFGIGLALTSGALAALYAATAQPGRDTEVAVLVVANLVATVVRFGLYRTWVFRGHAAEGGRIPRPSPSTSALAADAVPPTDVDPNRSLR
jgi:putative flippase GtrA